MIMTLDMDVTAERRHYNTHCPLKGKRLTTFCASLALLHLLLSLTHWIFRSLMLPYKSSSHSANHVRSVHRFAQGAADWRSGPRWSIISVLCPVHPFPLRGTSPQGETRDMREKTASHILHVPFRSFSPLVAGAITLPGGKHVTGFAGRLQLPYDSSSFATPASGGTMDA